jgi:hypothetical protein
VYLAPWLVISSSSLRRILNNIIFDTPISCTFSFEIQRILPASLEVTARGDVMVVKRFDCYNAMEKLWWL